MLRRFASTLETAGLAAISAGVGLWSLPAGLVTGGLSAVLVGVALERRIERQERR